jgi:hypothetical protein
MTALLDFAIESFNHNGCANKLPVFLQEFVEDQTGIQIAAQTVHGGERNPFIFGDKGCVQPLMMGRGN